MKLYQHPTEKAFLYTQQGSKKIYMGYYSPDGKRRLKSTKTDDLEEAKIKLQEQLFLIRAEKTGQITIQHDRTKSVSFIVDQVIKELEITKKPKTTYTQIIRKLKEIKESYTDLNIKKLTRKELKKLFDIPRSKPQLSYLKTAISKIFEYAEDEEIITGRPSFPKPTIIKFKKTRFPISEEQFNYFYDFLTEKIHNEKEIIKKENKRLLRFISFFLYETGARLGELKGVKFKDISVYKTNKYTVYLRDSKTKERRILIPAKLTILLRQEILDEKLFNTYHPEKYIFSRKSDGKVPQFTETLKMLKMYNEEFFKRNGMSNFVLYNLRHSYITRKLEEGFKIFYIAQHCGTSYKMIQDHYSDYIVSNNESNILTEEEILTKD